MMLLAFGLVLGLTSFLWAQESENDFVLVNKTGYVLDKVFVSPTKAEEWGEDIMGQDVLNDGDQVKIKFHPKAATGLYDLKVVYKDDNSSAVWVGYDLSKITKITIHYDKAKDVTTAEVE
ncbi:MAG: argininosuccinate lyase [Candidatus Riflebacteria bacterium]|nr:argininosuccinate lyase [Candidatus Riflebacteria bacterium]